MPQVHRDTGFFVVTEGVMSTMSFGDVVDAVKGGMDLDDVEIFDDENSARLALIVYSRRCRVEQFDSGHILEASSLVLFDEDGVVLDKVNFMPVEHSLVE